MGSDGNKQLKGGHVIPPGEILVQRFTESRAPELESLHSTIASRLNNDFRSQRNKRRRTTGYDNRASKTRFRKKQKSGVLSGESSGKCVLDKKALTLPRHIRRRKELNKNPESGFCTSGDGTKRLRTHVWHAKRFTMTKRWRFHLPLGLHGSVVKFRGGKVCGLGNGPARRGRGSRALLKLLKNGTIVHDASYHCAVQLEGLQDSLLLILSTIMSPFPSSDTENVLSGDIYATSMLHHAGAPNLGSIAPVIYMWRPVQQSTDAGSNQIRQLWIWIHAAALTQGFNALKTACESQGKVDEDFASVRCTSLEGQFGTLEVMGTNASQLLQKILHPVSSVSNKSPGLKKCSFMGADEEHMSCSGIISLTVSDPRAALTNKSAEFDSSSTDLWDAEKRLLCCPIEDNVVCLEKHHQRLSSFCLSDKTSDDIDDSTKMNASRFCPILLLRRNSNLKDSVTRWSIILPLRWVKAFWVPLVSIGAQAIGLRERSWVACEAGIPSFPSEFPECSSYFSLMETEAAAIDKEAALRPASVRPLSIPIPPPWNSVRLMNPSKAENTQVCCSESGAFADNDMVVARTSKMLAAFLNSINGDHFPYKNTTCLSEILKDGKILGQVPDTVNFLANRGRKVCFVRVILQAYKEGVIEDGAVVCAPRLADIKLWTSSSSNKGELQVPQSLMAEYFVKQDSGRWEFQVPNDTAAMESNRWPIGFVTTGFVRGSKKPSARALCDAVLLAHLRHEQLSSVTLKTKKKEIYVLTRNLRSTAYRLALASIVVEHQEEDLDHI